ncbi:MAG: class I SAM-dependent methyltransferase [Microcoleaceae cyanobacterium]
MNHQDQELLEKIRQQFDTSPYPRTPLETSPKEDYQSLFIHNLVTSYYLRNQRVIDTADKVILDAGCGSGFKSLILAEANPGAKIVGIDISKESIDLAHQRLEHYGFTNHEFHVLKIEELPRLGIQFDYINADEVLYLLPDITAGLQAMKAVLKPTGMIRSNLHSAYQRVNFFRVQELFKSIGLMDESPGEVEIQLARETLQSLKDAILIKRQTWNSRMESDEGMLANCLLMGDQGFTISDLFRALRGAELEFVSMVNWRYWEITDLFQDLEDLPAFLAMGLSEASIEEKLHLYELMHPIHRLLDFWCGCPNSTKPHTEISDWTNADWQKATVHLHPQLRTEKAKEDLINCIQNRRPYEISLYIQLTTLSAIHLESNVAACLLPLWEGPQSFLTLVERSHQIRPIDPLTLESIPQETIFEQVKELLIDLAPFLYILVESPS